MCYQPETEVFLNNRLVTTATGSGLVNRAIAGVTLASA